MLTSQCTLKTVIANVLLVLAATRAYGIHRNTIQLEIPAPKDSAGGIIVADVDNDSRLDYLVTVPGHVAAYNHGGRKLWILKTDIVVGGSSEREGLPGHCGPGVGAGDVNQDGECEVLFLTKDSVLHIVDGRSGREKASAKPPVPAGAPDWHCAVSSQFFQQIPLVNFRTF